jgi:anthranilate phosphoribosyltransferase
VVLNTAAGLVAAGLSADMSEGVQLAAQAIDSGAASNALDKLIEVSNSQAV